MYANNPCGQIIGDTNGLLKLIFSPVDKKLLGVHIIGEMASELIHIGAHVMAEAGSIDAFIEAVYNRPSQTHTSMGRMMVWGNSEVPSLNRPPALARLPQFF